MHVCMYERRFVYFYLCVYIYMYLCMYVRITTTHETNGTYHTYDAYVGMVCVCVHMRICVSVSGHSWRGHPKEWNHNDPALSSYPYLATRPGPRM